MSKSVRTVFVASALTIGVIGPVQASSAPDVDASILLERKSLEFCIIDE